MAKSRAIVQTRDLASFLCHEVSPGHSIKIHTCMAARSLRASHRSCATYDTPLCDLAYRPSGKYFGCVSFRVIHRHLLFSLSPDLPFTVPRSVFLLQMHRAKRPTRGLSGRQPRTRSSPVGRWLTHGRRVTVRWPWPLVLWPRSRG